MLRSKLRIGAGRVGWLVLGLMVAVGCVSNRGGGEGCGGGCGGGCCRAKIAAQESLPPAVPASAEAASVAQAPNGGQKTCPVTGAKLGSMGTPIPVTVNGQTVYVCCRDCAAKVRKDPGTYLARVMKERQGR